jgi:dCMP deaminase
MSRPDWDTYFTGIAAAVATRADCRRAQIGAVIVDQHHRIVSTGYNGTPPGSHRSCQGGDCPRAFLEDQAHSSGGYENCINLHAEQNAIAHAKGDLRDGKIYIVRLERQSLDGWYTGQVKGVLVEPCPMCDKLCLAAGLEVHR